MHISNIELSDLPQPQPVRPQFGLFFHGDSAKASYVTHHNIDSNGRIEAGEFVSPESVLEMTQKALTETVQLRQAQRVDFIPEHLLVDKPTKTVWYRPSCKRDLLFKFGSNGKQHRIKACLPALLFIRKQYVLTIFALNSDARPTLNSEIFHAPLMNVNATGDLCLGDARLPEVFAGDEDTLLKSEDCFFGCYSGHINHSHTLNIKETVSTNDLFKYFVEQEKQGVEQFDTSVLKSTKTFLKEII